MATFPLPRGTPLVSTRKSVVLPAPEAPMTASLSPGSTASVTPSRAAVPRNETATSSRANSRAAGCLLCCEEVKFPRLLFHVVVVRGIDLLVAFRAQKVEERRVVYVEEGLDDLLLQVVGEGLAHHPGIALYGVGLLDDTNTTRVDGALVLQVVQDAVLEAACVYLSVSDRLGRGIVTVGVVEVAEVRPVVDAPVPEHDRGVQRARGARDAPEREVSTFELRDLLYLAVRRYDDDGAVRRVSGPRVDLRDQRDDVGPVAGLHVREAAEVCQVQLVVGYRRDHGVVARRHRKLHLPPELLREVIAKGLVLSLDFLRVLVRDHTDPERIGVAGSLFSSTTSTATAHEDQRDQKDRDQRAKPTHQRFSFLRQVEDLGCQRTMFLCHGEGNFPPTLPAPLTELVVT